MILHVVPPEEYSRRGVPFVLIKAVKIINELIAIDALAVTEALGHGDHLIGPETYAKLLEHPAVVVGRDGINGSPALSGLGILNGILMTEQFRLYVETDDGNYVFRHAGIFESVGGDGT